MSDLSDLHGIFPTSLRWNAETGILGISVFNSETAERELEEIELGKMATFAMDMATRERGYGLIKVGVYDMKLTPVGSPAPQWMSDEEFKPAIGCWLWSPAFNELRLETNAAILRTAVANVWDRARSAPEFMKGLQPAVRFVDRVSIPVKAVNKTFFGPVIDIVGWAERNKIPGWAARTPTVALPARPGGELLQFIWSLFRPELIGQGPLTLSARSTPTGIRWCARRSRGKIEGIVTAASYRRFPRAQRSRRRTRRIARIDRSMRAIRSVVSVCVWEGLDWNQMSEDERQAWEILGWSPALWETDNSGGASSSSKAWSELTPKERNAAAWLGYTAQNWEVPCPPVVAGPDEE